MAFALSMDAFSISIGMGLIGLRYKHIAKIGLTVGWFHVMMPLIGLVLGKLLSQYIGLFAFVLGGGMLIFIGLQMIASTFQEERASILSTSGLGLILFAVSVSLDSFSAGLSLGMLGAKTWVTLVSFGVMSTIFTWMGLILGRKMGHYFHGYSEWLGGAILIAFGIKIMLAS
ncbi:MULTISPECIES: manganese efflux pump MntP family protein [Bacillaceae]|uniref:Putative manganese efflux pump MntP n=1 Tax=Evansella alkalicola TaxID=745819 RepID=A0ABS6K2L3_9BACI|nr:MULTISPECIES: manganese efflux pump MntP family protein [Bacillaceae]MBU9724365.1 manganese efflux pump MntP family protein [Bacillus alkalicola]